jgi:hypothetical protein
MSDKELLNIEDMVNNLDGMEEYKDGLRELLSKLNDTMLKTQGRFLYKDEGLFIYMGYIYGIKIDTRIVMEKLSKVK